MKYESGLIIRVLLALLLAILPIDLFYLILLKPTLQASALFLSPYNPTITNDGLIINQVMLRFIPACIATLAYMLLALLILLTKGLNIKKRIALFLTGSFFIFIANIIRVDALIYIYFEYGQDLFNKLHLFIWDILSSIFVAALWIFLTYAFKLKSIPAYDDIKTLYLKSKKS